MYECLNIHPHVKDTESRRRPACLLLFTFDLICHTNIFIYFCTAGEDAFSACLCPRRSCRLSLPSSEERNWLKHSVLMANYLVVLQWFNGTLLQRRNAKGSKGAESSGNAAAIWHRKRAAQLRQGEKWILKIREIEEVTVIYCDKGGGMWASGAVNALVSLLWGFTGGTRLIRMMEV